MPPETSFKLLSKDLLCTLCLKIIGSYKKEYDEHGNTFIEKLKKTCNEYPNKLEAKRCLNGFTLEALELLKNNNEHEICETVKLCKVNEKSLPLEEFIEGSGKDKEPIPNNPLARKYDGTFL
ncbi:Saposin B domain and Saposin-like domain-containing protein [Strongyloides ratti]|uniref:Saposin B domain and Saposin-like domain-containing protein n=1 Tax=Strongyloides ratti TaxID=34506 RepID=A0A090LST6_STRRB|nr:Saposin B domain and Saposin-like domain-containing protein [Strongyloides ratti]CEF71252.1 Saposin B domain and Saposin-like domain-containing protein [Strongyloides ratti]